jgi:glutamate-ammonia-ligase adenylyltransferase
LNDDNLIELEVKPLDSKNEWLLTLVGYDYTGELSLICGLLFVYGLNIEDGFLLTEEFKEAASKSSRQTRKLNFRQRRRIAQTLRTKKTNRRIADVFRVSAARKKLNPDMWPEYERELRGYIEQLRDKKHQEVQAHLAKRVALAIRSAETGPKTLLPVEIDIDNGASEEFTVLRINAADTIGFLYELSNALSLNGIHISRVHISSLGRRIHDTLFVTDLHGNKIVAPEKQQQLRAAVVLVKHFTHILPQLPNPESALMHFREFVSQLFTRESWTSELASIERPEVLNSLAKLLGASDFLWQDFLRMQHGNLFPVVENLGALGVAKSKEQLHKQMLHELSACTDFVQRREVLNTFKDREMFRIDMRYIQRIIPEFWLFSVELTHLGEIVLETAFQICYEKLREELGEPRTNDGNLCAICMCGLGKFGGREIGFASDIELMILYEGQGETVGGKVSSTTSEFVEKLIREILQAIKAKREGIFELDLRLRPYGKGSPLGVSYDSFERYFHPDGPAWNFERQALVRLRPIAGDLTFGAKIERLRDSYVYNGTRFDIAAMRAMREKQVLQLVQGGSINAKFSAGALVDIEYLVQGLQIMHGHDKPELRQPNTGASLASLLRIGFISTEDYVTLQQALDFLRRLIQGLRIVRGNAKDLTVPDVDSDQFAFLARRLGYEADVKKLQEDIQRQMANVRDVSRKLLG